jgi:hypothetical protein
VEEEQAAAENKSGEKHSAEEAGARARGPEREWLRVGPDKPY